LASALDNDDDGLAASGCAEVPLGLRRFAKSHSLVLLHLLPSSTNLFFQLLSYRYELEIDISVVIGEVVLKG